MVSLINAPGFNGLGATAFAPPDTNSATGPASIIETVNQSLRIFNKATGVGITPVTTLNAFLAVTGGLPPASGGSGYSDPVVVYDDNIPGQPPGNGRFIVADQDVDAVAGPCVFNLAVSKTATPATLGVADWWFYQIPSTPAGPAWADYPGNLGYNQDALVYTLNIFPTGVGPFLHTQVNTVSIARLISGPSGGLVLNTHYFQQNVNDFGLRPTTEHDTAPGAPMWFVSENNGSSILNVYKMTNVLSAIPLPAPTLVPVTPYVSAVSPGQPGPPAVITNNIDSRIQKVAERNNTLVACQTISLAPTQDAARWYAIGVATGAPVMQQQGSVNLGANRYDTYPGIDIDPSGDIGMSFIDSGTAAGRFMSMYITGRQVTDPVNTMQPPIIVPIGTGASNNLDGRAGDLSGINVDPGNGTFWASNECANLVASWATAIANFSWAGVTITESGGSTNVVENGATDTYTVVLKTPPTANVTITLGFPAQLTAVPGVLTFTPANWNVPQTVTVSGIDAGVENPTPIITHTAVSVDPAYNAIAIASVTVNFTDSDSGSSGGGGTGEGTFNGANAFGGSSGEGGNPTSGGGGGEGSYSGSGGGNQMAPSRISAPPPQINWPDDQSQYVIVYTDAAGTWLDGVYKDTLDDALAEANDPLSAPSGAVQAAVYQKQPDGSSAAQGTPILLPQDTAAPAPGTAPLCLLLGPPLQMLQNQTITFDPIPDQTFGEADFTINAVASSGLPVLFKVAGNVTITGDTVHLTGFGHVTILAFQPGDANFRPAPAVVQSFNITAGPYTTPANDPANDPSSVQAGNPVSTPPVPPTTFGFTGNPTVGAILTFAFTNPPDPASLYSIDWNNSSFTDPGDVQNVATAAIDHIFSQPGLYTVHGRILDNLGGFSDYWIVVTVNPSIPV